MTGLMIIHAARTSRPWGGVLQFTSMEDNYNIFWYRVNDTPQITCVLAANSVQQLLHSLLPPDALFAFRRYGRDAKVVHFLGKVKPWSHSYDAQSGEVRGHSLSPDQWQLHPDYLLMWWQLYAKSVLPLLQRAYGDTPFSSGCVEASEDVSQRVAHVLRHGCDCTFSALHHHRAPAVSKPLITGLSLPFSEVYLKYLNPSRSAITKWWNKALFFYSLLSSR